MKSKIYIDDDCIGVTTFQIVDESMGAIGGKLIPNDNYEKYREKIQKLTEKNVIANVSNFNFRIVIDDTELEPEGGIGITDFEIFEEIEIETAGNKRELIEQLKMNQFRII